MRRLGVGLCWLLVPAVLALSSPGCGGAAGDDGAPAPVDPKAADRNKQYNEYMMSKSKGKGLKVRKN